MNIIGTLGSRANIFQNAYSGLNKLCHMNHTSIRVVKNDFCAVQDLFIKNGHTQEFYDRTLKLTDEMEAKGKTSVSKLLLNELCKLSMNFRLRDNPEKILYKAISTYNKNGDGFHELARINDLQNLYKQGYSQQDYFKVLRMKKNCCKKILKDYEGNVVRFASVSRPPTSIDGVKHQLAHTFSQIALLLSDTKPKDATNALLMSKQLYEEIGKFDVAQIIQKRINRTEFNNNIRRGGLRPRDYW